PRATNTSPNTGFGGLALTSITGAPNNDAAAVAKAARISDTADRRRGYIATGKAYSSAVGSIAGTLTCGSGITKYLRAPVGAKVIPAEHAAYNAETKDAADRCS